MGYQALKNIHIALALVSVASFILRWVWMKIESPLALSAGARILPHVLDTLFLVSGIGLAVTLGIDPVSQPWLAAKIAGLVVYVVLGSLALKRAPTPRMKNLCFVSALLVFAWIISVARLKSPLGIFSLI